MIKVGDRYTVRVIRSASQKEKKAGLPYHVNEKEVTIVSEIPLCSGNQRLWTVANTNGNFSNVWENQLHPLI